MKVSSDTGRGRVSLRAETRKILNYAELSPKKSLGQHFMTNMGVIDKILELADVGKTDCVLEVGPGTGTLTSALLRRSGSVIAVEADPKLLDMLKSRFEHSYGDRFSPILKDALELCPGNLPENPNKLVSNLPYNIAARLILQLFQGLPSMQSATVMVQKEVAMRMRAYPDSKQYGAYSIKLSLYASYAGSFEVSRENFLPKPHVDSMVIRLDRKPSREIPSDSILQIVCMLADAGFLHRRKTFLNSCNAYFADRPEIAALLPELLANAQIDARRRAETFTEKDFIDIAAALMARAKDKKIIV